MPQLNLPSPIEDLDGFSDHYNVSIKREDLIHPDFGGNKWRKLKFNIEKVKRDNYKCLITFGGPFSNHIVATARACKYYGIPSIGIIRGDYVDTTNPSLIAAHASGMKIYHVSKYEYKLKEESESFKNILTNYSDAWVVPEGGGNNLAVQGASETAIEIREAKTQLDYIIISGGTGTTSAGLINGMNNTSKVVIINTLKNESLQEAIAGQLDGEFSNWKVLNDYHQGGFAKTNLALQKFAQDFYIKYNIKLDPIYNSKMMYAVHQLCKERFFKMNAKILCIHTGGHQGIDAWNYRMKKDWL
mgnify:CR=1 FL=1